MLNLTIAALTAASISRSPFLNAPKSLVLSKSRFHYHFSTVLFSNLMNNVHVSYSSFQRTLKSAAVFESTSFEDEIFTKQKVCRDASGIVTFTSCLFNECDADEHGGGLRFSGWDGSASLKISKTGFYQCTTSATGGALHAEGENIELTRVCIDGCSAKKSSAAYLSASKKIDVSHSYISNIERQKDKEAVFDVGCDKSIVSQNNFTRIDPSGAASALKVRGTESSTISKIYFARCELSAVLEFTAQPQDGLTYLNFVENHGKNSLIRMAEDIVNCKFIDCAIIKDRSNCIVEKYSTWDGCIFSSSYDPAMFPGSVHTPNCKWSAGWKTKDFDIHDSKVCWAKAPKTDKTKPRTSESKEDDSGEKGNTAFTSAIVVAVSCLIVVVIVIIFFITRWCRTRGDEQKLLMMYAQV